MVTDVKEIKKHRGRTYLVKSMYGMIWVLLSRTTRSRIQAGLFMVDRKWSGRHSTTVPDQNLTNSGQSDILYRITWFDDNDRARTRSRTKVVNWSTTLKEASHSFMNNAYSIFRSRKGSMEISWFPSLRHNNNHRTILWLIVVLHSHDDAKVIRPPKFSECMCVNCTYNIIPGCDKYVRQSGGVPNCVYYIISLSTLKALRRGSIHPCLLRNHVCVERLYNNLFLIYLFFNWSIN